MKNQLRFMWVLTFVASMTDRREVMETVSEFARRLRSELSGFPFPYWYSPELHPGGHGWHVNFFIAQRIPHSVIEAIWGAGFVWVTDFAKDPVGPKGEPLGLCRDPREGWRRAARYGGKYAQKDWSPEHVGQTNHRYEIAQGFSPTKSSQWVNSTTEAERMLLAMLPDPYRGGLVIWDSNDSPAWDRPPARTWRW